MTPLAPSQPDPMTRLRDLLGQLKTEADARGYHYFAVANDPSNPGVGAEVSAIKDEPKSVIRGHIQLHRDWSKSQGLQDVTWGTPKVASALQTLLAAKAHSDARRYDQKHALMRDLINKRIGDFVVDQDQGNGIYGLTHQPTGFRMHLPANVLPGSMKRKETPVTKIAAAEQLLQLVSSTFDTKLAAAEQIIKLAGPFRVGSTGPLQSMASSLFRPKPSAVINGPTVAGMARGPMTMQAKGPVGSAVQSMFKQPPASVMHTPAPAPTASQFKITNAGPFSDMRGQVREVVGAIKAVPQAIGEAGKAIGSYGKAVGRNLGNDAMGGMSAADTAVRAGRTGVTGAIRNAVSGPHMNPLNAPRAAGVGAERLLASLGQRASTDGRMTAMLGDRGAGLLGAGLRGTGQVAGAAGRGTSNLLNLVTSGPGALIPGTGRAAGALRGGLQLGATAVPTLGGGAYALDKHMRENGDFGLLGRGGRSVAQQLASLPTNPAAAAGMPLPGKMTPLANAVGGSSAGPDQISRATQGAAPVAGDEKPDLLDWISSNTQPTGAPS